MRFFPPRFRCRAVQKPETRLLNKRFWLKSKAACSQTISANVAHKNLYALFGARTTTIAAWIATPTSAF